MKEVQGWWLPDNDTHMSEYFKLAGTPEYQPVHRQTALRYCKKFRIALDIGAHVGLWSKELTNKFQIVHSFEPCKEFTELLTKNAPKATVHEIALGKGQGAVALEIPPDNTGMAKVARGVAGSVQMLPLDHYHFDNVDFIKIDVEGYELDVVKGGIETLRKNDPVIIVEQKEKHAPPEEGPHAAVRFLMRELKYKVVDRVVDDWILRKL